MLDSWYFPALAANWVGSDERSDADDELWVQLREQGL